MGVSIALKTSGQNINAQSSYATASITPGANKIILAMYCSHVGSIPSNPSISGCNLSWTQIATVGVATGNDDLRITLWRGISASPTTGAITFSGAGSPSAAGWVIAELTGADTANPIVQYNTNSNSSSSALSVSLSAFANANNATLGVVAAIDQDQTATQTPGSGFSSVGSAGWARRIHGIMEFKNTNDTTVDFGTTNTSADGHGGIAIEIRAATLQAVKTINGLAVDSMKTFNGLARASTKSINGLA